MIQASLENRPRDAGTSGGTAQEVLAPMQTQGNRRRVSGHIYRIERKRGSVWYWKLRLPYGGEERKAIGPEWSGPGRPPDGYFTRRTAQAALEARLTDLRRGVGIPARGRSCPRSPS